MFKQPLFWLLLSSALVVSMLSRNMMTDRNQLYKHSQDLPEILNLVNRAYVDKVAMDQLMPGVFQGAVEAVDGNASYVAPGNEPIPYWDKVYQKWGLVLGKSSGFVQIVAVAPGSPAATQNLKSGDFCRRIGSASTRQMNAYQARRDLANWEGPLPLTIVDATTNKERDLELQPQEFSLPKLSSEKLDGDILRVPISHFYSGWEKDLTTILQQNVSGSTKILLDFRNNALGEESALLQLAQLFLPKGEILRWQSSKTAAVSVLNSQEATFKNQQLYVLVDQSTAWAAEMFCASAQYAGKATVLGQKTLGLPMGYAFIPLKNTGFLHFCQKDAGLPSGQTITRHGITPDWEIPEGKANEANAFLEDALAQMRRAEPERKAS